VDGIVIPGGESTTVMKLLERSGLAEAIRLRSDAGMPVWGTCMGMIVTAHEVCSSSQPTLDLIDISVRRNAFGRQIASSEVPLEIPVLGEPSFPGVFIRAPWIERAGPEVTVLSWLDGHGILVRQNNVLGSAFHPELTPDRRLHEYFVAMVNQRSGIGTQGARA
jgi:5'-phosphate synthase pdxT subunit